MTLIPSAHATSTNLGILNGIGPYGNVSTSTAPFANLALLISNLIGFLTLVAGIYFLFRIITTGFKWITGGHDKQAIQDAQKQLSNAILGLLIVVLSYTLVGIVGLFLGFDILNLGQLIIDIGG